MTIKELKEILKGYDDSHEIFLEHHHDGYDDLKNVKWEIVALNTIKDERSLGTHMQVKEENIQIHNEKKDKIVGGIILRAY